MECQILKQIGIQKRTEQIGFQINGHSNIHQLELRG